MGTVNQVPVVSRRRCPHTAYRQRARSKVQDESVTNCCSCNCNCLYLDPSLFFLFPHSLRSIWACLPLRSPRIYPVFGCCTLSSVSNYTTHLLLIDRSRFFVALRRALSPMFSWHRIVGKILGNRFGHSDLQQHHAYLYSLWSGVYFVYSYSRLGHLGSGALFRPGAVLGFYRSASCVSSAADLMLCHAIAISLSPKHDKRKKAERHLWCNAVDAFTSHRRHPVHAAAVVAGRFISTRHNNSNNWRLSSSTSDERIRVLLVASLVVVLVLHVVLRTCFKHWCVEGGHSSRSQDTYQSHVQ